MGGARERLDPKQLGELAKQGEEQSQTRDLKLRVAMLRKQKAAQSLDTRGRGVSTKFGDYFVVPDGTSECFAGVEGEQISESEFAQLQALWAAVEGGTGNLKISERDATGKGHAGFKAKVLAQIGKLMSQPVGRGLIGKIVNGGQAVTIQPTDKDVYGGMKAAKGEGAKELEDGKPNVGGTTTIKMDPGLTDADLVVYDKDGKEIAEPLFLGLGHELIHAVHNTEGKNRKHLDADNEDEYTNKEEEDTIETGDVTENDLRAEHGEPERLGHGGEDKRYEKPVEGKPFKKKPGR